MSMQAWAPSSLARSRSLPPCVASVIAACLLPVLQDNEAPLDEALLFKEQEHGSPSDLMVAVVAEVRMLATLGASSCPGTAAGRCSPPYG